MIHHYDGACIKLSCVAHFSHDVMNECEEETAYDPACKHDYGFKVLMHNINELTCQDEQDRCGDEISMGNTGWGEPGSSISSRMMNKPSISK